MIEWTNTHELDVPENLLSHHTTQSLLEQPRVLPDSEVEIGLLVTSTQDDNDGLFCYL